MQVQPYLFFEGRCEEAVRFYEKAIGAKVMAMMRFSENPDPQASETSQTSPTSQMSGNCSGAAPSPDQIMHCAFTVGESLIMASDGVPAGEGGFKGISLSLAVGDDAEAKRLFDALGTGGGGQVQVPLMESFFATSFGMVVDRFGVGWMVVAAKPMG